MRRLVAAALLLPSVNTAKSEWKPAALQPPHARLYDDAFVQGAINSHNPRSWFAMLDKLDRGEAVTVVTIGSSIVDGSHGVFASSAESFRAAGASTLSSSEKNRCGNSTGPCVVPGSVTALMQAINATWPHPGHTLFNNHGGNELSGFGMKCNEESLPASADLLIFEQHHDAVLCCLDPGRIEALYHGMSARFSPHGATHALPLVVMSYVWITDPKQRDTTWTVGLSRQACPTGQEMERHHHRLNESLFASSAAVEDSMAPWIAYYG